MNQMFFKSSLVILLSSTLGLFCPKLSAELISLDTPLSVAGFETKASELVNKAILLEGGSSVLSPTLKDLVSTPLVFLSKNYRDNEWRDNSVGSRIVQRVFALGLRFGLMENELQQYQRNGILEAPTETSRIEALALPLQAFHYFHGRRIQFIGDLIKLDQQQNLLLYGPYSSQLKSELRRLGFKVKSRDLPFFPLSNTTIGSLAAQGIYTVPDLTNKTLRELEQLNRIGDNSLAEVLTLMSMIETPLFDNEIDKAVLTGSKLDTATPIKNTRLLGLFTKELSRSRINSINDLFERTLLTSLANSLTPARRKNLQAELLELAVALKAQPEDLNALLQSAKAAGLSIGVVESVDYGSLIPTLRAHQVGFTETEFVFDLGSSRMFGAAVRNIKNFRRAMLFNSYPWFRSPLEKAVITGTALSLETPLASLDIDFSLLRNYELVGAKTIGQAFDKSRFFFNQASVSERPYHSSGPSEISVPHGPVFNKINAALRTNQECEALLDAGS